MKNILDKYQRAELGAFPTPLTELKNLSTYLKGPRIIMKRDDLTGLALGGNKTRKLEYLTADALQNGCDTIITAGASQSNHCCQTAAAAAAYGLECHLALGGKAPDKPGGNLLIDTLLGADIHWTGSYRKGETIPEIAENLQKTGKKPYIIPYGGSNEVGVLGFINALQEVKTQLDKTKTHISHIVFASSSGGTHAGMLLGTALFSENSITPVGIAIDKQGGEDAPLETTIHKLAGKTWEKLNPNEKCPVLHVKLITDYLGEGYGIVGELERNAIRTLASKEGILVDPVYTGRAMGGLMDMVKNGYFSPSDTVLFWHTGGSTALFPYAGDII